MRNTINFNACWAFTKLAEAVPTVMPADWENVNLPHTWNGEDGQDGGADYYRALCYYTKKLDKAVYEGAEEVYIEFEGANSSADVYVNGQLGLLLNWCSQGFPISIEEMAKKYLRLMHSPLLSTDN